MKAADVDELEEGLTYEVTDCSEETLKDRTGQEDIKLVLHLRGVKPVVLNTTNINVMLDLTKSPETDDWVGAKVGLYTEPTPMGKGVRLRAVAPPDANAAPVPF